MVWNHQVGNSDAGYTWKKVPTEYKVGSQAENLFWRVHDGATEKHYFYSPFEYESFSGIPIEQYKDQVDAWTEKQKTLLKDFNTAAQPNTAMISESGRSYNSFFPTAQTESTIS
jgi:hypothetical protein